jgi:beta-phosphoglucomutase-like phosphatase (HAD superfamily)
MMAAGPGPKRVRAHVLAAVSRPRCVVLDFDGVMFDVRGALGRAAREEAVVVLLCKRKYRPRPLPVTYAWFGVHRTIAYLAEHEPDHAVEAEAVVSNLELQAALTAYRRPGLDRLFAACVATGRRIAVISDMSEAAVLATLQAHGMYRDIAAVAARQGLDLSALDVASTAGRVADLLGVSVTECLVVSGSAVALYGARDAGAIGLGHECGRDRRKHLAAANAPVVPDLATLSQALLT